MGLSTFSMKGITGYLKGRKRWELIVGVTTEKYDMERGNLNVVDPLPVRMENVRKIGFVDESIIEETLGQKVSLQRIGVIGAGRIANRFVPEVKLVSGVSTQVVYNSHKESAERFSEKYSPSTCFF